MCISLTGLEEKVQLFLCDKWNALTASGLILTIMKDERFHQLIAHSMCKHPVK